MVRICSKISSGWFSNLILVGIIFLSTSFFDRSFAQGADETIRINEFMASNSTGLKDEDGEYSDWIEIFNPTQTEIDLANYILTDDANDVGKWKFPQIKLAPNSYLIVFASGKNRTATGKQLHTNFKLAGEGEFLALINKDGKILNSFDPSFPPQQDNISYAFYENDFLFSSTPTPGSANKFSSSERLGQPSFSHKHGFYELPFNLEISSDVSTAKIYYTTDGSDPSEKNGQLYSVPISITTTTVVRAVAIRNGFLSSKITTATFLFLKDVNIQTNTPPGYPSKWGPYTAIPDTAIADYGVDSEITRSAEYSPQMKDAFLSIPTISIVTDKNNLFSKSTDPQKGGIYIYTGPPTDDGKPSLGLDWERPASIEYFDKDGSKEFQVDCGLKIHGGHSRRPEKCPKHSFRITFSSDYGISKLDFPLFGEDAATSFNTFILRASYGNTWLHMSNSERQHAQLIHDLWGKDTQLELGHPSGHGNFVHLYINGMYWGVYNPTERIDGEFAESYMGGSKEDYDVIKDNSEVVDGNINAWKAMFSLAVKGFSDNVNYMRIQGMNPDGSMNSSYPAYLDMVNFIDYMIINFYGANWDWDGHNWIAVRNRIQPDKGFKFFSWDAEHLNETVTANNLSLNNANCPSFIFQKLRENSEFRKLFADRVQNLCFDNGVLTPESGKSRWMKRANEIELAIIAESARWGDYRRDVHRYSGGPYDLYTKSHWLKELYYMTSTYFPQRTNEFIKLLRAANLFPGISAPIFLINGKSTTEYKFNADDKLSFSGTGTIYFTTDGTDPLSNGQLSSAAVKYSNEINLVKTVQIKARAVVNNEWSALSEKVFVLPTDIKNLKITELHYHPLPKDTVDDKQFEFIELKNVGTSIIDLTGFKFVHGISYVFPVNSILKANEFIVLASNRDYFKQRYSFSPFDQYDGSFDNSGEKVVMTTAAGDTIISFRYNDKDPWPIRADGDGYSLEAKSIIGEGNSNDPNYWRASYSINGSPGRDDISTDIKNKNELDVPNFQLFYNYPNPFNPSTTIKYSLSARSHVKIEIFSVTGEKILTLVNDEQETGDYKKIWNAENLTSGIYIVGLAITGSANKEKYQKSLKVVLIK